MPAPRRSKHAQQGRLPKHEKSVLVLQGGGALGAYQAGVYEGMAEWGFAPSWVTGVSIGAINAALIAGNAVERRLERLRAFWERVSSGNPIVPPTFFDPMRLAFDRLSAMATSTFGAPGFFTPRVPPPYLAPDGSPDALSIYDTSPLRQTLAELVDFDLLQRAAVRLSVGATDVHTGNSVYFDSQRQTIGPEHIMASGALPPGFPPIVIDGNHYWDGGMVSNSPLWYVLDDAPNLNALIAQVDLFHAKGPLPQNLDEVLDRSKDIQYSSKTRFNTNRAKELEGLRAALGRLMHKLPPSFRDDPDYRLLAPLCDRTPRVTILHLINRQPAHALSSKDYAFSRSLMQQLWQAGLEDVRRSCADPQWDKAIESVGGVRAFDLAS